MKSTLVALPLLAALALAGCGAAPTAPTARAAASSHAASAPAKGAQKEAKKVTLQGTVDRIVSPFGLVTVVSVKLGGGKLARLNVRKETLIRRQDGDQMSLLKVEDLHHGLPVTAEATETFVPTLYDTQVITVQGSPI